MTTYFTPVGTLAELTRAKGSDINAREAAVTAGFTAIETAIAGSTGVMTYGGGWADDASKTRLTKVNGMVTVALQAICTDGSIQSTPIGFANLPSGFRPPADIYYAVGTFVKSGTITIVNCEILTTGAIRASVTDNTGSTFSLFVSFPVA